jgi:LysM repeat protein
MTKAGASDISSFAIRHLSAVRLAFKTLFLLLLTAAIFGSAWYSIDRLFLAPKKQLKAEKEQPPPPPPPDESLPELEKCLAIKKQDKWIEARKALEGFLEQHPDSTRLEEARDALGEVNARILLTPVPAPEKQIYVVRSGDVITRVATRTKSTPELIMRANNLTGYMLRIDQKLSIPPTDFRVIISRKRNKVVLFNGGKYFKQYAIRSWPQLPVRKGAAGPPPKIDGKVAGKLSWHQGQIVSFTDKVYAEASHEIQLSISNHTLYGEPPPGDTTMHKPPTGIALDPAAMPELVTVLAKGDPVTIE